MLEETTKYPCSEAGIEGMVKLEQKVKPLLRETSPIPDYCLLSHPLSLPSHYEYLMNIYLSSTDKRAPRNQEPHWQDRGAVTVKESLTTDSKGSQINHNYDSRKLHPYS